MKDKIMAAAAECFKKSTKDYFEFENFLELIMK